MRTTSATENQESKLGVEDKKAIGILSLGTFLEYFDLMLYVHMAVLLNELFFPKSDPRTEALLAAFAFCSTYVLRPVGALFFGWLGDNIGRKATVIITTFMMALCCFVMANLPTYAQIGITAAYIVTACRIFQGMSSMGEIIGAELYLTETTSPPSQYVAVSIVSVCSALGGFVSLGVASIVTLDQLNWRAAFYFGAAIAAIGVIARVALRETPEFINAQWRIKKTLNKASMDFKELKNNKTVQEKVDKLAAISLFAIQCAWPVCFYFVYIHCGNILKTSFGYSGEEVIHHNFLVSIAQVFGFIMITILCYYVYPLNILKFKAVVFFIFTLASPYFLSHIDSPAALMAIQSFVIFFALCTAPAIPIFYKNFPVFKRYTFACLLYALPRAIMPIISSLSFVFLSEVFGSYCFLLVLTPVIVGYALGVFYFEKLDISKKELRHNKLQTAT